MGCAEHIYVIVRIELDDDDRLVASGDMSTWEHANDETYGPILLNISATKAYRDLDIARREAERLNALKAGRHCRYFVTLARLQKAAPPGDAPR